MIGRDRSTVYRELSPGRPCTELNVWALSHLCDESMFMEQGALLALRFLHHCAVDTRRGNDHGSLASRHWNGDRRLLASECGERSRHRPALSCP